VANAFASDDCSVDAKDSTAWKDDPGTGETVSPDAILRYWSPPVMANRERVVGLWGRNVMANPPLPPVRKKLGPPPSTWQISTGPWTLTESQLVREHGGVVTPVVGGTLRIGCDHLVSGDAGLLPTTQLPAGRYWAEAWWDEPVTGIRWSTPGEVVEAQEGETHAFTFRLQPPPDNLRCVLVHVHMDNVNRKAVGKDWWDHPEWTLPYAHLGEDFADPVVQIPQPGQDNPFRDGRDIDDWGRSEFELSFTLVTQAPAGPADPPQWSVRIGWKIRINQHDQDDPWTDKGEVIAPPKASPLDPGVILEDDLQRLDLWPVRSHIRIEVHNNRA
jgi:hypothetical protein